MHVCLGIAARFCKICVHQVTITRQQIVAEVSDLLRLSLYTSQTSAGPALLCFAQLLTLFMNIVWIAAAAANAQEALELFANEPFTFALKPIVKRVLLGIASENASIKQV